MVVGTRVSQRMLVNTALNGLNANIAANQRLQEQVSSGRLVTRGSDDPAGATYSMQLRSQQTLANQYLVNIDDADGRLNTADDALQSLANSINNVKSLVVNVNDSGLGSPSRSAIAAEISEIRNTVVDTYNTTYRNRPIFGGTVQGSVAVDSNGSYVGNEASMVARIDRDVTIRTDVSGQAAGADKLPALLTKIVDDINTGSTDISDDQDQLDSILTGVLNTVGDVGARASQVDTTKTRVTATQLDVKGRIAGIEDIDLPKAILELQASAVAYQASLGAAGKVLQTSLLDYLR
jgi:flagellar hook-associated protein 3 FlgL